MRRPLCFSYIIVLERLFSGERPRRSPICINREELVGLSPLSDGADLISSLLLLTPLCKWPMFVSDSVEGDAGDAVGETASLNSFSAVRKSSSAPMFSGALDTEESGVGGVT